jgi:hypothetical protein
LLSSCNHDKIAIIYLTVVSSNGVKEKVCVLVPKEKQDVDSIKQILAKEIASVITQDWQWPEKMDSSVV